MEILATIIPVFLLVIVGWLAYRRGFMPPEFLGPANRLVYYLAIPALIFSSVARASLRDKFHGPVLFATLLAAAIAYAGAGLACRWFGIPTARRGAFIQSAGHGNLGYIGLTIAFYFLGQDGVVRTGILVGFLMILQNTLSVIGLQLYAPAGCDRGGLRGIVHGLFTNPVIVAALAGILVSALRIPLPAIVTRSLDMLSGLAPPMALLLIGASLSVKVLRSCWRPVLGAATIKLLFLPALGLLFYRGLHLPPTEFVPGLILLASPTATISYVMAREMHGAAEFAVAAISASTILSAATFSLWLALSG